MKVLVVDDNKSISDLLIDYMCLEGIEADAAENGVEAIDKLVKDENFDAVVTDGQMPRMNGFELCRFIKTRYPTIYTIGITDSIHLDKFREAGADECFYKPVDLSSVCTLIRNQIYSPASV